MWPRRSNTLPPEIRASLVLGRGERPLAWAADSDGRWLVGTARALHLSTADGWTVLSWERIDRAGWDRDSEQLEVVEVAEFGQVQPRHLRRIGEPGRLLELVHERVTASVVITRHVPVGGSRGLRIVGRRAPMTDAPVTWTAILDEALDPDDPRVQAALDEGLAAARREVDGSAP